MAQRLPSRPESDYFDHGNGEELTFQVEIADSPAKRELGLQYRRDLAADRGMIFLFSEESRAYLLDEKHADSFGYDFYWQRYENCRYREQAIPFSLDPRSVDRAESVCAGNQRGLANAMESRPAIRVRFRFDRRTKIGGNKQGTQRVRFWIPGTTQDVRLDLAEEVRPYRLEPSLRKNPDT